ncbi:hypothetical protein EJ04DRAFT_517243 [Polyplosphaeria fusca]|uniref:Uncharacterized protein n=1 Tax=Polyplosphaeria fusca TaxID=682080 RepID=A0A9P4QM39_9PLEO|nr:hypothetical protein EJ04DRAFT_517243 [Polyplosphaeria fusca]
MMGFRFFGQAQAAVTSTTTIGDSNDSLIASTSIADSSTWNPKIHGLFDGKPSKGVDMDFGRPIEQSSKSASKFTTKSQGARQGFNPRVEIQEPASSVEFGQGLPSRHGRPARRRFTGSRQPSQPSSTAATGTKRKGDTVSSNESTLSSTHDNQGPNKRRAVGTGGQYTVPTDWNCQLQDRRPQHYARFTSKPRRGLRSAATKLGSMTTTFTGSSFYKSATSLFSWAPSQPAVQAQAEICPDADWCHIDYEDVFNPTKFDNDDCFIIDARDYAADEAALDRDWDMLDVDDFGA